MGSTLLRQARALSIFLITGLLKTYLNLGTYLSYVNESKGQFITRSVATIGNSNPASVSTIKRLKKSKYIGEVFLKKYEIPFVIIKRMIRFI